MNKLNKLKGMFENLVHSAKQYLPLVTKESEEEKNKRIEEQNEREQKIAELKNLQNEFDLVGGNKKNKGGKRKTRRNLKKNKKSKRKTSHRRR